MKNRNYFTLVLATLFVLMTVNVKAQNADDLKGGYEKVYETFGLAKSTVKVQNTTQMQIQKAMLQLAKKQNNGSRPKPNSQKSAAFFTANAASDNFKIIADTVGQDEEQRALFKQLFAETQKGFDAEMSPKGRKNNLAAAMTFFIATTVTIYNDDPEPNEETIENLFQAFSAMYDETPEMANVPNKDKQFLHDTFVAFSAMPLAFYVEAKEKNDEEMLKLAKIVSGALLLDILKINPNDVRFEGDTLKFKNAQTPVKNSENNQPQQSAANYGITKNTTNFDDGWVGTQQSEYVSLKRNGVEVRLFYANKEWENSIPSTTQYDDFYWAKTVTPYFNAGNLAKWSDAGFFMEKAIQADAVDRQTGKRCFVTLWFVGQGENRGVTVVVAPNRNDFQQEFPNLKNISNMTNANRFAVTAQDMVGTWLSGTGGGGFDYYSVNSGSYIGSNTLSQDDEFVFNSDGTYQHIYKSANLNTGSSQFAKLQYRGKFSVTDWELTATNHYGGKTVKFTCQLVAVRGGILLVITDTRIDKRYTLFKKR